MGYHDHYLTDGGRARIILSVLVTPSEVMENQVMLDLLWQTCFRWKLRPDQIATRPTAPSRTSSRSRMRESQCRRPTGLGQANRVLRRVPLHL
jgi:hypothetical protein